MHIEKTRVHVGSLGSLVGDVGCVVLLTQITDDIYTACYMSESKSKRRQAVTLSKMTKGRWLTNNDPLTVSESGTKKLLSHSVSLLCVKNHRQGRQLRV